MMTNVATDYSGNLRFECSFSKKAIKYNTILMFSVVSPMLVAICYISIVTRVWAVLTIVIFSIIILIYSLIYVNRLTQGSYLEITADGKLKCKYKGRAKVCYPINEIKSIEEASLKEAEKKYAVFPVTLNTRGMELYPETGVLITFNRSWIKSVFPVYFNPADVEGFIAAIKQKTKI